MCLRIDSSKAGGKTADTVLMSAKPSQATEPKPFKPEVSYWDTFTQKMSEYSLNR